MVWTSPRPPSTKSANFGFTGTYVPMNRNNPIRQAAATKPSASGPGDRIADSGDIAIYLREDCRPLADSLQLEMVVAQYDLRLRDVESPQGIPVGDAASDIQQALMALGYSEKDAALALKALPKEIGVSEGIKLALKALAR